MVLDDFIRRDFWLERLIRDAEMIAAVVVQACQWVEGSVSEEREGSGEKFSDSVSDRHVFMQFNTYQPAKKRKVASFQSDYVTSFVFLLVE